MMDQDDEIARKIADLDGRMREVEALQALILRILSTTRPLDAVLEQYGATKAQQQAVYQLLDEVAARAQGPEYDRPTRPYFLAQFERIFLPRRNDRAFVDLVIETLKIERLAYRDLHAFMEKSGWLK